MPQRYQFHLLKGRQSNSGENGLQAARFRNITIWLQFFLYSMQRIHIFDVLESICHFSSDPKTVVVRYYSFNIQVLKVMKKNL